MNTNPDNTKLMLWLDDELDAAETAAIESWAATHAPSHLEQRKQLRSWKQQLRATVPAEEEMPYGDFFQSRLLRDIEREQVPPTSAAAPRENSVPFWRKWLTPAIGAAACVLAFMAGNHWNQTHSAETLITYTPEEGVKAEYFVSSPSDATVIVLNGVDAMSDSLMNPETASAQPPFEENSEQAASLLTP